MIIIINMKGLKQPYSQEHMKPVISLVQLFESFTTHFRNFSHGAKFLFYISKIKCQIHFFLFGVIDPKHFSHIPPLLPYPGLDVVSYLHSLHDFLLGEGVLQMIAYSLNIFMQDLEILRPQVHCHLRKPLLSLLRSRQDVVFRSEREGIFLFRRFVEKNLLQPHPPTSAVVNHVPIIFLRVPQILHLVHHRIRLIDTPQAIQSGLTDRCAFLPRSLGQGSTEILKFAKIFLLSSYLVLLDLGKGDLAHQKLLAGVTAALLGLLCASAGLLASYHVAGAHESVYVVLERGHVLLVAAIFALCVVPPHLFGEFLGELAIGKLLPTRLTHDHSFLGGSDREDGGRLIGIGEAHLVFLLPGIGLERMCSEELFREMRGLAAGVIGKIQCILLEARLFGSLLELLHLLSIFQNQVFHTQTRDPPASDQQSGHRSGPIIRSKVPALATPAHIFSRSSKDCSFYGLRPHMIAQMESLVINISLLGDIYFDILLLEHLEEGLEQRLEFLPVDRLVTVDVQQVEEILDVVLSGLLSPHEIDEGLHHFGELALGEAVVLVMVEFVEDLVEDYRDILLCQLALPHRNIITQPQQKSLPPSQTPPPTRNTHLLAHEENAYLITREEIMGRRTSIQNIVNDCIISQKIFISRMNQISSMSSKITGKSSASPNIPFNIQVEPQIERILLYQMGHDSWDMVRQNILMRIENSKKVTSILLLLQINPIIQFSIGLSLTQTYLNRKAAISVALLHLCRNRCQLVVFFPLHLLHVSVSLWTLHLLPLYRRWTHSLWGKFLLRVRLLLERIRLIIWLLFNSIHALGVVSVGSLCLAEIGVQGKSRLNSLMGSGTNHPWGMVFLCTSIILRTFIVGWVIPSDSVQPFFLGAVPEELPFIILSDDHHLGLGVMKHKLGHCILGRGVAEARAFRRTGSSGRVLHGSSVRFLSLELGHLVPISMLG